MSTTTEPSTAPDELGHPYTSDDPRRRFRAADHPSLIEEHHVVGPHGEDEIEATPLGLGSLAVR